MAHIQSVPLDVILEKEKLHESRTNFVDWFHNVRTVLKGAKDYVLDTTLGEPPALDATESSHELYEQ
jgi:hypothetical protein